MLSKNIKDVILNLFTELRKDDYGLSNKQLLDLFDMVKNTDIVIGKGTSVIQAYDGTSLGTVNFSQDYGSYVLEYPPLIRDNTLTLVKPIMHLFPFEDTGVFYSTFYHELCHIFSIGKWNLIDNQTVEHVSGISIQQFLYNGMTADKVKSFNNANSVSEELNDWVAEKLYELVEKEPYHSNKRPQKAKCSRYIDNRVKKSLNNDYKKLIGFYFSHNLTKMKQILIPDNSSLDELNAYFENKEVLEI